MILDTPYPLHFCTFLVRKYVGDIEPQFDKVQWSRYQKVVILRIMKL